MEKTWASGALELLKHADEHVQLKSAFDKRIAFISIDNSVETSIRTFLSLPYSVSEVQITKKEIEDTGNSFPKMVGLLYMKSPERVSTIIQHDIEFYHRIRNQVYHEGTGLSVDDNHLNAYRQIAAILISNLYGLEKPTLTQKPTVENLILAYEKVSALLQRVFKENSVDAGHTYKWEIAIQKGVLSWEQVNLYTELQMNRNYQAHSANENLDFKRIQFGLEVANKLTNELEGILSKIQEER